MENIKDFDNLKFWFQKDIVYSALRISLSTLFSGIIAMRFGFSPSTAIMSATIISLMTSTGDFIGKFLSRMVGTILGGIIIIFISPYFLNDANNFVIVIVLIVSLSAFMSNLHETYLSYMFSTIGIAVSIIAYPTLNNLTEINLFNMTESRMGSIFISIICSEIFNSLLPPPSTNQTFQSLYTQKKKEIKKLIIKTIVSNDSLKTSKFLISYSKFLKEYINLKKIISLDPYYKNKIKEKESLNKLINLIYLILKFQRFCSSNNIDSNKFYKEIMKQLINIEKGKINTLYFKEKIKGEDLDSILNYKIIEILEAYNEVNVDNQSKEIKNKTIKQFKPISKINILNSSIIFIRSFTFLFILNLFIKSTGWDYGYTALLNASIIFAILPSKGIDKISKYLIVSLFSSILIAIVLGFFVQYFLMPQIDSPLVFFTLIFTLIYIGSYIFFIDNKYKIVAMYFLFYWTNYINVNNITNYEISSYINSIIPTYLGFSFAFLSFFILPSMSNKLKEEISLFFLKRKMIYCFETNKKIKKGYLLNYFIHLTGFKDSYDNFKVIIFLDSIYHILHDIEDLGYSKKEIKYLKKSWIKDFKKNNKKELIKKIKQDANIQMNNIRNKKNLSREEKIKLYSEWLSIISCIDLLNNEK